MRPSKLTQEITDKICEAVSTGLTFDLAAQVAGVSPRTFYRWMRKGEDEGPGGKHWQFRQEVKRAEAENAMQALATINQAGHDGSWQAHAWLLERRHKGYRRDAPQEPQNLESLEEEVQTPEQIIEAIAELPEEILVAALNRRSVAVSK